MLTVYEPKPEDLWFKQLMLADEATMSYNHAYGGTIPFPPESWPDWYRRWMTDGAGKRFYRYLRDASGAFVGEIAYHYDAAGRCMADVVIYAKYRGRGDGKAALRLLCQIAKENGVSVLYDEIAADNPAVGLFIKEGFAEVSRTDETVTVRKALQLGSL